MMTTKTSKGRSTKVVLLLRLIDFTNSVMPSTRPTFAMLEPSAFPTANSPDPDNADMTEIRISGAEVPTDTIVSPIIMGVRPARSAIADAPSTNLSALQTNFSKPMTMTAENHNTISVLISSIIRASRPPADRVSWHITEQRLSLAES